MAQKIFNSYWNIPVSEIHARNICTASRDRNSGSMFIVQVFWRLFELRATFDVKRAAAINQSSLQVEKSLRSTSTDSNRDEISISDHGISRIVKGIDLHFFKEYLRFRLGQLEILIFKGITEKLSREAGIPILPKKLYIRPIILHFYNI